MRPAVAALLHLLAIASAINFANPFSDEQVNLNEIWVDIPSDHVALGGDLRIHYHGAENAAIKIRIAREEDDEKNLLATMPLALDSERQMSIPCGYFSRGGTYYLELVVDIKENFISEDYDNDNSTNEFSKRSADNAKKLEKREIDDRKATVMETEDSIVKTWKFSVFWPSASLDVTPEQIQTYPERAVTAIIEFPNVVCTPVETTADFWLELLYCGHSSGGAVLCDGKNSSTHAHVLYSEQMHGFPGRRTMTLRCELFGQAGDYALTLRPAAAAGPQDLASAFVKADWSEQFVLNVHGGSVFPCGEGIRVLFQYPECVLEGADRVRVFGRDGEKLRYVAERRVRRGQHTASFDCRLFTERYPEYCFVYVSQAVTGAVADVRMDCLPTFPLSEGGAGKWGEWSPWSACPAPDHCSTRTRSRHRFCDSPPPAYGAKYCEGKAVELEACECKAKPWAGDSNLVVAEVGARCRCGCVLHLAPAARLLAGSARACPARSFWLLQAEENLVVRLRIESVKLPCTGQALKIRDGDSLGSPLLASWDGPDSTPTSIRNASAVWASISVSSWWASGGGARLGVVAVAGGAAVAAVALALCSAHRTRAYQRAADKESLTDSDACSASLELGANMGSRSTLISEVVGGVSLRRLLPSGRRHTRLRDVDRANDGTRNRDAEDENSYLEADAENDGSNSDNDGSEVTITPEGLSSSSAPAGRKVVATPSPLRRSHTISTTSVVIEQVQSPPQESVKSETTTAEMNTSISSVSDREMDTSSEKDRDSVWEKERCESRASSSTSAATLTNGWYSPALSGVNAARIRGNSKHTKESCNRRLLKSDLSLTSHPEMEMDYYDYEVNNAGSVPGSYLGMDPAFLVWIPPLEEGDIMQEMDHETQEPVYEEIVPKGLLPDPGSNTESPEEKPNSNTLKKNRKNDNTIKKLTDRNLIHPLNFSITDLQHSPKLRRSKQKYDNDIPLRDLTLTRSPVMIHSKESKNNVDTLKRVNDTARETKPAESNDISDIKFADDSESSNDIKFADDDTPDSNKLADRFDVEV